MRRGRKKVENPETARRILAAAEAQFAAQGLAGARTDRIAASAHANKAMLYYYFGDKRRLHRAVLENLFREIRSIVEGAARSEAPARQRLLGWVSGYFDFLSAHPNYPRIVQREAMQASRDFEWIARDYFYPLHNLICRIIEDGIESGEFRRVDSSHTVFSILGMTAFYFLAAPVLARFRGVDALSPQALAERKRALLDLIEHALFLPETRSP